MDEDLKARLFKPRCPERDIDVPDVGVFRVRGLTRAEIKTIAERSEAGKDSEAYALSVALVNPALTEDEVRQWLQVAPFGEVERVTLAINELSGIAGKAAKEAYKSLRDGSDAGMGVLPGGEASHDGGGPAADAG